MKSLTATLKKLQKTTAHIEQSRTLQLPLWPSDLVGTPNVFLRSALFPLMPKQGEREHVANEMVASLTGSNERVQVWFTGQRFCQQDLDTTEAILHLMGQSNSELVTLDSGQKVLAISAYALLKASGRRTSNRDYLALEHCLERLRMGVVRILVRKSGAEEKDFGGPLLLAYREGKGNTGRYLITPNPMLKPFFESGSYSLVNLPLRLKLSSGAAKWLFGFYSTHAAPMDYSLDKLKVLSGSSMNHVTRWKQLVTKGLDELVSIGFLKSYFIDKHSNVSVERTNKYIPRKQLAAIQAPAAVDPRQQSLL